MANGFNRIIPAGEGDRNPTTSNEKLSQDLDNLYSIVKRIRNDLGDLTHSYSRLERGFYAEVRGQVSHLCLLNGENLEAKILGADKYSLLVLESSCSEPYLLLKSAIWAIKKK